MSSKCVNRVILMGNCGAAPVLKHTKNGTAVCTFTLATNERIKDAGGNWQDRTEWHNVTVWARNAEIASEYLRKGAKVYLEGSNRTESWMGEDGSKKYRAYVNVDNLVLLGKSETGHADGQELF